MKSSKSRRISIVEIFLAFALLLGVYSHDLNKVVFHGDESGWIATSSQFEAFYTGQLDSPLWNETYWTITQPPMARYIIGFWRRIGGFQVTELNKVYDFKSDLKYNVAHGRLPVRGLLWWSRFGMSVLSAGSMVIGFILLLRAWGRPAAYSWILLCCTSTYFLLHLRRAMGESPLLFFVLLSVICGCLALRSAEQGLAKRSLVWFSCMGVSIGLAASCKLNGGSVIIGGGALAILAACKVFRARNERLRYAARALLLLGSLSGFTFIAVYPYLWRHPIHGTVELVYQRFNEMHIQRRENPASALYNTKERVEFLARTVTANTASSRIVGWPGTVLLTFLGLGAAFSAAAKWIRGSSRNPIALVLMTVGLAISAPVVGTLLKWERYELFPVFMMTLLVSVGAGVVLSGLARLLHNVSAKPTLAGARAA